MAGARHAYEEAMNFTSAYDDERRRRRRQRQRGRCGFYVCIMGHVYAPRSGIYSGVRVYIYVCAAYPERLYAYFSTFNLPTNLLSTCYRKSRRSRLLRNPLKISLSISLKRGLVIRNLSLDELSFLNIGIHYSTYSGTFAKFDGNPNSMDVSLARIAFVL